MDAVVVDGLRKKLVELRERKSVLERNVAQREALLEDVKTRLHDQFGLSSVEEGEKAIELFKKKAQGLEDKLNELVSEAEKLLGGIS